MNRKGARITTKRLWASIMQYQGIRFTNKSKINRKRNWEKVKTRCLESMMSLNLQQISISSRISLMYSKCMKYNGISMCSLPLGRWNTFVYGNSQLTKITFLSSSALMKRIIACLKKSAPQEPDFKLWKLTLSTQEMSCTECHPFSNI